MRPEGVGDRLTQAAAKELENGRHIWMKVSSHAVHMCPSLLPPPRPLLALLASYPSVRPPQNTVGGSRRARARDVVPVHGFPQPGTTEGQEA